jgi:hypothetical protein
VAKPIEQNFEANPTKVFSAAKVAIAKLGWAVLGVNDSGLMITCNTGRSIKSFAGQDLQVTVIEAGSGSNVIVGGQIARRGGRSATQQLAWGEKGTLTKKLLSTIGEVLANSHEAD